MAAPTPQVEEVRNPALREVPLGVTQKYLIVTANYPASGSWHHFWGPKECGTSHRCRLTSGIQARPLQQACHFEASLDCGAIRVFIILGGAQPDRFISSLTLPQTDGLVSSIRAVTS